MAIDEDGRRAVTHYKVLERFGKYTLVRFELETGRTHQIRVHAASLHHPIVGDEVYGGSTALYKTDSFCTQKNWYWSILTRTRLCTLSANCQAISKPS